MEITMQILAIDDDTKVREMLSEMLSSFGYECVTASNGREALNMLRENHLPIVISDIRMPGIDGIQLLTEIKEQYPDTDVISITGYSDNYSFTDMVRNGASDFIAKPFAKDELEAKLSRIIRERNLKSEVARRVEQLQQAFVKIKNTSLETIYLLSRAAEYKDEETGAHIQRMSRYAAAVAGQMNLKSDFIENILYASPMHDIGKIGVPDHILLKPGKLDPDEWEIMKQHTIFGGKILEDSNAEFIKTARVIALTHHERWDGSGYPKGLKGLDIPLCGRITSVADCFDALTSKRPYRKTPFTLEKAFNIIKDGRGSYFDPEVVDTFFAATEEILAIIETYKDKDESQLVRMVGKAFNTSELLLIP